MPPRHTELLWSPHFPEVFAIGTSESLKLYEFSGTEERQAQQNVQLIGSVTDVQQLKCVAWSPNSVEPWTLAVGTAVGKVVLHDLRHGEGTPTSALCEFVPRFQRVCFSLAWNGINRHQIAAGLDKVRGDSGVLVWDINAQSATQQARDRGGVPGAGHARSPLELHCGSALRSSGVSFDTADDFSSCVAFDISSVGAVRSDETPAAECGNSEAAVSVAWLPGSVHPCGQKGARPRLAAAHTHAAAHSSRGPPMRIGLPSGPRRRALAAWGAEERLRWPWCVPNVADSTADAMVADAPAGVLPARGHWVQVAAAV